MDVDSSQNVVPMLKAVKSKFDRMRLCIVPEQRGVFKVGLNTSDATLLRACLCQSQMGEEEFFQIQIRIQIQQNHKSTSQIHAMHAGEGA